MANATSSDRLFTRAEAAERLGVTVACLDAWAHRGTSDLPYVKVGGRARYRNGDIEEYLRRHTRTSAAAHAANTNA